MTAEGSLLVVATPVGNLGDLSPRAARAIEEADTVACEDTRRTAKLLAGTGLKARRLVSLHAHNERERTPELIKLVQSGATVALVSDAGTPTVSDPGSRLVEAAVAAGIAVSAIPGASAVLLALVLSGFDTARFCFEGFLPRRGAQRRRRLAELASETRTTVMFESPVRLGATLEELAGVCGPTRRVAVARELTKLYEEVWRGDLAGAAQWAGEGRVRGECTIVVEGRRSVPREVADEEIAAALERRSEHDSPGTTRDVVDAVARELGLARRRVYDVQLQGRSRSGID